MTAYITYNRLGESYGELLALVMSRGARVSSRIGETRELLNLQLVLFDPTYCLVGRAGMNDDFAYEELTQLLAGTFDAERLRALVPRAADLITEETAYGPRTVRQLEGVEHELRTNPLSRRAVVYVGHHSDLLFADEKRANEMPCTCYWQFLVRDDALHMTVCMRSWDLVWGLSYDVPSFVAVQGALARALDVSLGTYTHFAGSAHVYERHFELMTRRRSDPLLIERLLGDSMVEVRERARVALATYEPHEWTRCP